MSRWVKVASADEFGEDGGKVVRVEGRSFAVFRVKGEFFVLNNSCLHRGGPLGEGDLEGYTVICPWHGWSYDVRTGSFDVIPTLRVKAFPVRKDGDSILVELGHAGSPVSEE